MSRYHARVCGFRSGVTLPDLLKLFPYCYLDRFYGGCIFITIGKLFKILGVLMKNGRLNSSVLADFNL